MTGRPSMPGEYRDRHTATRLHTATYLHGAGTGDAGMQLTLVDELAERAVCVRLPGPVAAAWLDEAVAGLAAARERAVSDPWGEAS